MQGFIMMMLVRKKRVKAMREIYEAWRKPEESESEAVSRSLAGRLVDRGALASGRARAGGSEQCSLSLALPGGGCVLVKEIG